MASPEETLAEYEKLFAKRFTSEDEEYMKTVNRPQASPPCLTDWLNTGYRDSRSHHGSGSDGRGYERSRHDSGRDHGRRYGDHEDRHRGGDRHGSYHHRDDRYGGRYRDDRGHRGYEDRQRPSTEYGSRGYYEFFY
ncbi:RNMT-activating mini protein-like [Orbicella faveolata]|uniref:RNMT-activating mini protein-like n=1 Tax=Orbicella faveolata TaxID=48498 RepID=UPI0009E3EAD7|nr:RNMT-activating mini protein-like [Orbicella faveolata]